MTQRQVQKYDDCSWRYVLAPAVVWTIGVVGACVVGLTSSDDELAATGTPRSSRALLPARAASIPWHAFDKPDSRTTGG